MNEVKLSEIADAYNYSSQDNLYDLIDDWLNNVTPPDPPAPDNSVPTMLYLDFDMECGPGVIGDAIANPESITFVVTGQGTITIRNSTQSDTITEFPGPVTGPPVKGFDFEAPGANEHLGKLRIHHTENLPVEWFGGSVDSNDNNRSLTSASWTSADSGGIPVQLLSGTYDIVHTANLFPGTVLVGENTELKHMGQGPSFYTASGQNDDIIFAENVVFSTTATSVEMIIGCPRISFNRCKFLGPDSVNVRIPSTSHAVFSKCDFGIPLFLAGSSDVMISETIFSSDNSYDDFLKVSSTCNRLSVVNCLFTDIKGRAINIAGTFKQGVITGNVITREIGETAVADSMAAIALVADGTDTVDHVVIAANQISTRFDDEYPHSNDDPGAIYISGQCSSVNIAGNSIYTAGRGASFLLNIPTVSNPLQYIMASGNNIVADGTGTRWAFRVKGTGTTGVMRVILQANSFTGTAILEVDQDVPVTQLEGLFIVPNSNLINGQLDDTLYSADDINGFLNSLPQDRYSASGKGHPSSAKTYYGSLSFADQNAGDYPVGFRIGSTTDPADPLSDGSFVGMQTKHYTGVSAGNDNEIQLEASADGVTETVLRCYVLKVDEGGGIYTTRRIAQLPEAGLEKGALVLGSKYIYIDSEGYLRASSSVPSTASPGDRIPFQADSVPDADPNQTSVIDTLNKLLAELRLTSVIKTS